MIREAERSAMRLGRFAERSAFKTETGPEGVNGRSNGFKTIREFANLLIVEILSPLQGWTVYHLGSRADALRFILSPRWGVRFGLES
jgi:hypothetical protein